MTVSEAAVTVVVVDPSNTPAKSTAEFAESSSAALAAASGTMTPAETIDKPAKIEIIFDEILEMLKFLRNEGPSPDNYWV
jgi:hypothetical protein